MLPSHHWAHHYQITDEDIDYLIEKLLERETPLKASSLARELIEHRLNLESEKAQSRFEGSSIYQPTNKYKVGQKTIFPRFNNAIAEVIEVRKGNNEEYGSFDVIKVQFFDDAGEETGKTREFAAQFTQEDYLSEELLASTDLLTNNEEYSVDDIFSEVGKELTEALETRLKSNAELISLTGLWFPTSLMMDVNAGHLNLAEAILDINEGGPMTTEQIIDEIGGLGNAPKSLQIFSMNYALNADDRFDEVGPVNTVLWFLKRGEPAEVQTVPNYLRYTPIQFDQNILTPSMLRLEREIDDEWSNLEFDDVQDPVTIKLIYPHRRCGTLPLNARMRQIFPTARKTPRVYVTLVDGQDNEEYTGWVVRQDRYVYGLAPLYRKHRLPVGATVNISSDDDGDRIIVDFNAHRPRTEYVRLIVPRENQISFSEQKRGIGADYDDLMVLGADEIAPVDALMQAMQQQRRSLNWIVRHVLLELSHISTQGNVHFKTLYSAVNVLRRCPPGPIFAALLAEPDIIAMGDGDYWKIGT